MSLYLVWEEEYPEEGSTLFEAASPAEAMAAYLVRTGQGESDDLTPLDWCVPTADDLAARGETDADAVVFGVSAGWEASLAKKAAFRALADRLGRSINVRIASEAP